MTAVRVLVVLVAVLGLIRGADGFLNFIFGGDAEKQAPLPYCNAGTLFEDDDDTFKAQSGQDQYVLEQLLLKCGTGVFVEFGGQDGIHNSNSLFFERQLGWQGIMFEGDPAQAKKLKENRPQTLIYEGAVCPKGLKSVEFAVSKEAAWSGIAAEQRNDISRSKDGGAKISKLVTVRCYDLATVLKSHNLTTIDYMTIDTEGSELSIIEDFAFDQFNIQVVQIEQLAPSFYPEEAETQRKVETVMRKAGYKLHKELRVGHDTNDLVFVKIPRPSLSRHSSGGSPGWGHDGWQHQN